MHGLPRTAKVIGGPELQQETGESVEAFEARVNAAVEETIMNNELICPITIGGVFKAISREAGTLSNLTPKKS
jgi:hypothetical protein